MGTAVRVGPSRAGPVRGGALGGDRVPAALVAFAAATLLLLTTMFLASFAALLAVVRRPDDVAGPWLVGFQLLVAVGLVVGGALLLTGRWLWVVLADAALFGLSVYWLVVSVGSSQLADAGPTGALPLSFMALAVGSAVLAALPVTRSWVRARTRRDRPSAAPAPPAGAGA